jgi:hypothetical protein
MAIATKFWTYSELKEKVERDLDLEGEVFIQPEEMQDYFNEGVDRAEEIVHTLYEDYFLDKDPITLVSGTNEYAMPSRIYAHKIRRVIYRNGSRVYPISRIKDWKKFEEYSLDLVGGSQGSAAEYRYFILNQTAGSPKILFTPEVGEAGAYVTVWFLRQANRFASNSDVLDVPEAANFVMQYVKCRCYEKEGHPGLIKALSDLTEMRLGLEGVLSAMVPDADNEIEMDTSFYGEMN